jgi:diguanylate cyclase (GGDEF)-like protein
VTGEGADKKYYFFDRHTAVDDNGRVYGSFLSIRDITKSQVELKREKYNATHDKLTGLYNREYLLGAIHDIVTNNRDKTYYVAYLDVSDFKIINDIYGTEFGDYVLKSIADWISYGMSDATVFGRLGGDKFGVCQPVDEFPVDDIEEVLRDFKVRKGSIEHTILLHLGLYEVRDPDIEVSVMFDRARMAQSTIKNQYNIHIAYYDDKMRADVLWSQKISGELQTALTDHQIKPFLQPLVDSDGRVVGAEVLSRWVHPEEGLLSPARFIPVFEQNGMIADLDKYMWRSACEILSDWKTSHPDLFLSVNISPKDFYFMDVANEIRSIVREYDVDPSKLRVEITETVMMSDVEKRINMLLDLQTDGFLIEMDDFGSGYSSLNLLKDMPVDVIKIDMMFLNRSRDNLRAKTILHNIITLTDDLGIESLTEGVETGVQYKVLSEMGCKLFQGYYFSKPVPREEFEAFCNAYSS